MSDAAELRGRLAAARLQAGLGTAAAQDAKLLGPGDLPTPVELATQQVDDAIARGRIDLSGSPRWPWYEMDQLCGKMFPGDLVAVCSVTGNGKTTHLMSAIEGWERAETSSLYIPLEVDCGDARRRFAAWRLGLDWELVHGNDWDQLERGAQEAHEAAIAAQNRSPYIHFAPPKRPSVTEIERWIRWAVGRLAVRVVIIDHIHRLDYGVVSAAHRLAVTDGARTLRDLARELEIVILAAAQLNRKGDPLDRYLAPTLDRVKESAGISEEAATVLMLSRGLKRDAGREDFAAVREGRMSEADLAAGNIMRVTCRKHRHRDRALDRGVNLEVKAGRVVDHFRHGGEA